MKRTVLLFLTVTLLAGLAPAASAEGTREILGTLPDGTKYGIQVPQNWNGVVINDLDHLTKTGTDTHAFLLQKGYALSGTERHPDRETTYDPIQEIRNQVRVLDIVENRFGKPEHAIQLGCSGGGAVAMGIGETYPDKVDGVIPTGYQSGIVLGNMWLDLLFALKALLAPGSDLPVVNIAKEDETAVGIAWTRTLAAAQQTPDGRAKIALAVTLAQWPTWGSFAPQNRWETPGVPPEKPDPDDLDALQTTMYYSALDGMRAAVTNRDLLENSAGGVASWNTGVDYERYYTNADPAQSAIVRQLYRHTALDLRHDLNQVNQQPRITADPGAVDYWRAHPRTHAGRPEVPVLHMHTIGDAASPPSIMAGYAAHARAAGRGHLYRQAIVDATDHCTYNVSETTAAIETMIHRIETGHWRTNPRQLNELGRGYGVDEPRYIRHHLTELNRAFFTDSESP